MTLEEKGTIVPPPVLSTYPEMVSRTVQQWEGIISATHWEIYDRNQPNGADFYVGALELGHIHLDGEIHLAITSKLADVLIKAGLAQKFPWGRDWVQFKIRNDAAVNHGIWLFRLNYDRLKGASTETLMDRITSYKASVALAV